MTDRHKPHDTPAHAPRFARIARRSSTRPCVARDTHAHLDTGARAWLRLCTIVDALLHRVTASRNGRTARAAIHPIAEHEERLDG
jgi:hypothetical protein